MRDDDAVALKTLISDGLDANAFYSSSEGFLRRNASLLHWASEFDAPDSAEVSNPFVIGFDSGNDENRVSLLGSHREWS